MLPFIRFWEGLSILRAYLAESYLVTVVLTVTVLLMKPVISFKWELIYICSGTIFQNPPTQ